MTNKIFNKIVHLLNKTNPSVQELIDFTGRLVYVLGASLAGFKEGEKPPELETIQTYYNQDQTVDLALMLAGLRILSWTSDFSKKPKLSNLANRLKETYK